MGRLIDAGLVLDNLSGRLESMKDYDAVKDVINNMPTAYDSDKVVEQVENERKFWEHAYDKDLGKEKARSYAHAIEIVKGGVSDGN